MGESSWLRRVPRAVWLALALACVGGCFVLARGGAPPAPPPIVAEAPRPLPGTALDADHSIGSAVAFDNLTVFPIYAKEPSDADEYTTLDRAMARGEAEVREVGSRPPPEPAQAQVQAADGAEVSRLEIDNRGALPIMVLAGTIVKGGKQDRQIGEDVVVAPHRSVSVGAFCVERGRWNAMRDGAATEGKFQVAKTLAIGAVRTAGQYEANQGEVWNKVAEVNATHRKETPSGTLLATLDDADVARARDALAQRASDALAKAEQRDRIVGVAFAVDGAVRTIRWFTGPKLFALHEGTLLATAALEALTAQAAAKAAGRPIHQGAAAPESAKQLVDELDGVSVGERKTGSGTSKAFKKSASGYASEVELEGGTPSLGSSAIPAKSSGSGPARPRSKAVTKDFSKK